MVSLTQAIDDLTANFDLVGRTAEARVDSGVLKSMAKLAETAALNTRSSASRFDLDDFLERVIAKCGRDPDTDELDWAAAGEIAFQFALTPPTIGFMLGPVASAAKERKARAPRKAREAAAVVVVPEVDQSPSTASSATDVTRIVKSIYKDLVKAMEGNEGSPVPLLAFVCNPDESFVGDADVERGFSQTVENLLYLSFLLKDGKIGMATDADGETVVRGYRVPLTACLWGSQD
jgi:hypothetical protein